MQSSEEKVVAVIMVGGTTKGTSLLSREFFFFFLFLKFCFWIIAFEILFRDSIQTAFLQFSEASVSTGWAADGSPSHYRL